MNEPEDPWEVRDLSKSLKEFWVGVCKNKNQGEKKEMGGIKYGVPRVVSWQLFPFIYKRIRSIENILNVFSAETSLGKEAEFINEGLPDRNKIVKFFRLLLLTLYLVIMICLIMLK